MKINNGVDNGINNGINTVYVWYYLRKEVL